jgi:hypothetical protein
MALVTTYATLQTHLADVLNRTDLTDVLPNFIQQFEGVAKRGIILPDGTVVPLRNLVDRGSFQISADGTSLPTDIDSIESLYHDGPTYFGPITIVPADQIGPLKAAHGDTGVPQFAAITAGTLRFAPEPDATYTLKMTYWQKITALSASNTTNWLLTNHPDIYIYGALCESAPYLKDDARLALWKSELLERVFAHENSQQRKLWGGGTTQRRFTPIGG